MFGIPNPLLIGGAALIAVGVSSFVSYNHGISVGKNKVQVAWDKDTKRQLEDKLALAKTIADLRVKNQDLSNDVTIRYVDRTNTITETKWRNNDVIREVFRESAFLSRGWVYSHDQLAKGLPIEATIASDRTPSKFTEADSLRVIANNYSIANIGRQNNESWNSFYSGLGANYSLQPRQTQSGSSVPASSPVGPNDPNSSTRNN